MCIEDYLIKDPKRSIGVTTYAPQVLVHISTNPSILHRVNIIFSYHRITQHREIAFYLLSLRFNPNSAIRSFEISMFAGWHLDNLDNSGNDPC